jgi:hypothetical protein
MDDKIVIEKLRDTNTHKEREREREKEKEGNVFIHK